MEKNRKPVVVGIGELLWDLLPSGKRAGGAPVNFVYHATQSGADGYAVSAVGNDRAGDEIIQELENAGIKGVISRNDHPTGSVAVRLNGGLPSYEITENVAWDYLCATPEAGALLKNADAVCFGTLASRHETSRTAIKELLLCASEKALLFFDANLRGTYYSRDLTAQFLERADIFKMNDEEFEVLKTLFDLSGDPDDVCGTLLRRYGLKYLIFTAGEKFSAVYSSCKKSLLQTPKVTVKDTVGAGDAFSGAFIYNILTGKTQEEAHCAAVKTAAFVATQSGAWPAYEKGFSLS